MHCLENEYITSLTKAICGAHAASYRMGTGGGGDFSGGKAAAACGWPITTTYSIGQERWYLIN
jgi:hypothetical protein